MKYSSLLLMSLSIVLSQPAWADIIKFNNGDVISGEITKVTPEAVTIKPSLQQDLELKFTQDTIKTFLTDKDVTIELEDKKILTGKLSLDTQKNLKISEHTEVYKPNALKEAYTGSYQERHGLKIRGHLRGGLNAVSGNNNSKAYDASGLFIAETEKNRFTSSLEYGFSKEGDTTTRDRSFGRIKYDHFISDKVYTFANADFERDVLRDLNLRSAIGAGLGYRFYNQDDLHLDLEIAPNYVNEDFDAVPDRDNDFAALRWGLNYDQLLFEKVTVFHNHRALQSIENTKDLVINARTGINVPIMDSVQAGFEWRLDWNNNPVANNSTTDHSYIANIGYYF